MIYDAALFGADRVTAARPTADPETGAVAGMLARWGQCLRGTGAMVCQSLDPLTVDAEVWRQSRVETTEGALAVAGMALGPPHAATDGDGIPPSHKMLIAANLAALVVPHVLPEGLGVAGVIAPEAIERWGSAAEAAAAINRVTWSVHAGPTQDRPGVMEVWDASAVISSGLPQPAITAAPCDACAAAAQPAAAQPAADLSAIASAVADELERRRATEAARAAIAASSPLSKIE